MAVKLLGLGKPAQYKLQHKANTTEPQTWTKFIWKKPDGSTATGTEITTDKTGTYTLKLENNDEGVCNLTVELKSTACVTPADTFKCGADKATSISQVSTDPVQSLQKGDYIIAGDFAARIDSVSGNPQQGWTGTAGVSINIPDLIKIEGYMSTAGANTSLQLFPIKTRFTNIQVNSCYQLMPGDQNKFSTTYKDDGSNILDVDDFLAKWKLLIQNLSIKSAKTENALKNTQSQCLINHLKETISEENVILDFVKYNISAIQSEKLNTILKEEKLIYDKYPTTNLRLSSDGNVFNIYSEIDKQKLAENIVAKNQLYDLYSEIGMEEKLSPTEDIGPIFNITNGEIIGSTKLGTNSGRLYFMDLNKLNELEEKYGTTNSTLGIKQVPNAILKKYGNGTFLRPPTTKEDKLFDVFCKAITYICFKTDLSSYKLQENAVSKLYNGQPSFHFYENDPLGETGYNYHVKNFKDVFGLKWETHTSECIGHQNGGVVFETPIFDGESNNVELIQVIWVHEFVGHFNFCWNDVNFKHHKVYELMFKYPSYKNVSKELKLKFNSDYIKYLKREQK